MEDKESVYEKIPAEHGYNALTAGNSIQRFWHKYKFGNVIDKVDFSKKVLDVGCGGGILFYLAKDVKNGVGLDGSSKQIEFAKSINKNAVFVNSTATKLPFRDKSFDYVTCIEMIEHMSKEDSELMLKEIHRVLKDDGKFILTTPNYKSLWPMIEYVWSKINPIDYCEEHVNKQTFKSLEETLLKSNFKINDKYSFFIISPFMNFMSDKLAKKMHDLEIKMLPRFGNIMLVETIKA